MFVGFDGWFLPPGPGCRLRKSSAKGTTVMIPMTKAVASCQGRAGVSIFWAPSVG